MNQQQVKINNNSGPKNSFIINSQQNSIILSRKDVKLSQSSTPNHNNRQNNSKDLVSYELQKQNLALKNKNKQLVKQLQIFSKKLDAELKKRIQTEQRKSKIKPEEKQSIEIQNLYKKIEIYKKQIAMLKSKIPDPQDNKVVDYQNKLKLYMKGQEELRQQIKILKKTIKRQEKGLTDIGAEGFLKINQQNQRLKQQLRKARLQIDQVERKYRTNQQTTKKCHTTHGQVPSRRILLKNQNLVYKKYEQFRKKNFSEYRMKTEPESAQKDSKTDENQSQLKLNKSNSNLQKVEKLQYKIRLMNAEKQRQREIIQNLKIQLIQKDKQINYLRERIQTMRKVPKARKQRNQSRQKILIDSSSLEKIQQLPSRSESNLTAQYNSSRKPQHKIQKNRISQKQVFPENQYPKNNRYPKIEVKGQKREQTYKWNDHQFSSKIKEIQVFTSSKGKIQAIHMRYEKGEPVKPLQLREKKFTAFVCQQSSEFIQQIKGGFQNGYLRYLVFKTNQKRLASFGTIENENECENFVFEIGNDEYPCALFGQIDKQGISRFGCLIDRLS